MARIMIRIAPISSLSSLIIWQSVLARRHGAEQAQKLIAAVRQRRAGTDRLVLQER